MQFTSLLSISAFLFSLSSLAIAAPEPVPNPVHANPKCTYFSIYGGINQDEFNTIVRVWRQFYGAGGGNLGSEGDASVCCSDWCLSIENGKGVSDSWTDAEFETTVELLAKNLGSTQCQAYIHSPGVDAWLTMSYLSAKQVQSVQGGDPNDTVGSQIKNQC